MEIDKICMLNKFMTFTTLFFSFVLYKCYISLLKYVPILHNVFKNTKILHKEVHSKTPDKMELQSSSNPQEGRKKHAVF